MRRLLIILPLLLLSLAPIAGRAATFSCSCAGSNAANTPCDKLKDIDTDTQTAAEGLCTSACVAAGKVKCEVKDTNSTGATPERTVYLKNPLGSSSIPQLVSNILKAAVGIVGALALLTFVYGGFLWLTSAGEAGKIQQGKDAMKWAIVGLAVVFSSYALVSFVLSALTKVT